MSTVILTDAEMAWLHRLSRNGGTWPDRPFLASPEAAQLMRKGFVEVIKPVWSPGRICGLPHARLTQAGWEKADTGAGGAG